jgi:hypothetical protein
VVFHQLVFGAASRFSTEKAAADFCTAAQRSSRARMAKSKSSDAELLDRLFAAIGKADSSHFERFPLEFELSEIRSACSKLDELPIAGGTHRELLKKFRANKAKRRKLRDQLRPVRDAIVLAGWLRQNPGADEAVLRATMQDDTGRVDPAAIEDEEDQDIAFLIDQSADYRKRQVRKLAVEPFLRWLEKQGVVPHPKRLPRTRMMRTFFDWLGVDARLRHSDSGVRTIAWELKAQTPIKRRRRKRRRT